jgi:hypothetical protein
LRIEHGRAVPLQQIYDRWIAKFERPRLKALGDLKRRPKKALGRHSKPAIDRHLKTGHHA